ncbi:MAG: biotin synthase BioB [Planctomycetota bacterium]
MNLPAHSFSPPAATPAVPAAPASPAADSAERVAAIAQRLLAGGGALTRDEGLLLADATQIDLDDLLYWANKLRRRFVGDEIQACGIVSAKTGACSEDCKFCAQSSHYETQSPVHKMLEPEAIAEAARRARDEGAYGFGIVMSGYGISSRRELDQVVAGLEAIGQIGGIEPHGSFGIVNDEHVSRMKAAGLVCANHNLETSERYYAEVCSTHSWRERYQTVQAYKRHGVKTCSGGLFGMGENWADRVDLALALAELDVDNVPMNFLHHIDGTPFEHQEPLAPRDILRTIAIYRFALPKQDIGIYGGREVNLRDLQSWIFHAGANAMMVGNYLTTTGRNSELDQKMVADLGLRWAIPLEGPAATTPPDRPAATPRKFVPLAVAREA